MIHGKSDRLVRPSGGRATAKAIPGARLELIEGMGHDLPRELWPQIVDGIAEQRRQGPPPHASGRWVTRHPFERFPRTHRRLALVCIALLAFAPVVAGTVSKPLHEDEPGGKSIIDFELAGSVEEANEVLAVWRAEGVIDDAKAIQIFDLIYPLIYGAALAGACVAAAGAWRRAGRPSLARAGIAMAWVAFAAAGFDYVENLGSASRSGTSRLPRGPSLPSSCGRCSSSPSIACSRCSTLALGRGWPRGCV